MWFRNPHEFEMSSHEQPSRWQQATRRELQAMAKEAGIKANLKSATIIAQLDALACHHRRTSPSEGGRPAESSAATTEIRAGSSQTKRRRTWERPPAEAIFSPRRHAQIRACGFPILQQPESGRNSEREEVKVPMRVEAPMAVGDGIIVGDALVASDPENAPDGRRDHTDIPPTSTCEAETAEPPPQAVSAPQCVVERVVEPRSHVSASPSEDSNESTSHLASAPSDPIADAIPRIADQCETRFENGSETPTRRDASMQGEASTHLDAQASTVQDAQASNFDDTASSDTQSSNSSDAPSAAEPFVPSRFAREAAAASPHHFYEQMQKSVTDIMRSPAMRHGSIRRPFEGLSRRLADAAVATAPSPAAKCSARSTADQSDVAVRPGMDVSMIASLSAKRSLYASPARSNGIAAPSSLGSLGKPSRIPISAISAKSASRFSGGRPLSSGRGIHKTTPSPSAARPKAQRTPLSDGRNQIFSPWRKLSASGDSRPLLQPEMKF